jgi:beta-mannanase
MAEILPTIKVRDLETDSEVIINQADFNAERYEKISEAATLNVAAPPNVVASLNTAGANSLSRETKTANGDAGTVTANGTANAAAAAAGTQSGENTAETSGTDNTEAETLPKLMKRTLAQLIELAAEKGLTFEADATKQTIATAILAADKK